MSSVEKRFLKYVSYDTQSAEGKEAVPSTDKQFALADELAAELKSIGLSDVRRDEHGYVYGFIPATEEKAPALGLISHMDTSPDCSGADIHPQKIAYAGGDIQMDPAGRNVMRRADFPALARYEGKHLICTDGTTLLGADDKAGVAEIVTAAEQVMELDRNGKGFPHGRLCIGFTPDEEVGRGTDFFDLKGFGADYAYTVDGGALGELEYENFNAASMTVHVRGVNIHPGSAKNKMKNALEIAIRFADLLPAVEKPEHTEHYEGFFHLHNMSGDVEQATLSYIIRDHDRARFEEKKKIARDAAAFLNAREGEGTVTLEIKDSYYNMKEKIEPCRFLIDNAEAAMKKVGIEPLVQPIRGGTDGARLSYEGLPCPNLCTGGENFHGRFEFLCCEDMEQIVEMLVELIRITGSMRA